MRIVSFRRGSSEFYRRGSTTVQMLKGDYVITVTALRKGGSHGRTTFTRQNAFSTLVIFCQQTYQGVMKQNVNGTWPSLCKITQFNFVWERFYLHPHLRGFLHSISTYHITMTCHIVLNGETIDIASLFLCHPHTWGVASSWLEFTVIQS